MILREATRKICSTCGDTEVSQPDELGCDCCKTLIVGGESLDVTVFFHDKDTEVLVFCSWTCVFEKLKTVKTDYFIALPFLLVDRPHKASIKGFWKAIKETKK